MKYLDTFAGIGGFSVGIHAVDPLAECIGYSEIDKYACSVYEKHYPGVPNYGNITKINADELPDFDCLVGGFPCQAFSIAGKRHGFEDTRGTLFFDLARILKAKTPRLFVFENVKGLLNHKDGSTFRTIIATIDELGYDCQWQVINSKNHGVPQNRERVIIVGHLRGTPRPEVFPIGDRGAGNTETQGGTQSKGERLRRDDTRAIAATLASRDYKGGNNLISQPNVIQIGNLYPNGHNSASGRVYDSDGISPTLDTAQGGNRQPKILSIDYKHPNSETRRGRIKDGYTGTLDRDVQQGITDGIGIRRLTPLECERLQAFPDEWTRYGIDESKALQDGSGYYTKETIWKAPILKYFKRTVRHEQPLVLISDTQRYKMCGNAVTTNVIRGVFERILA